MLVIAAASLLLSSPQQARAQGTIEPNPGQLCIVRQGKPTDTLCALERTEVEAWVTGFGARVQVVQTFHNPSKEFIEAVYTFPLPHDAAVDSMRMQVGDRVIEGTIKRREEARRIYEAAKNQGQAAGLLDQERPNIFTQSVANIPPGAKVRVQIGYVQILPYEDDQFEFTFPMVVGPRYLGNAPDPAKIAPPITPKGTRTGSNIGLTVHLDAGARIEEIGSKLHEVNINRVNQSQATITLARRDEIQNMDFIMRYRVASDQVRSAFLTHMDEEGRGGFFSLILLPPKQPKQDEIAAREVIFVMDQSGSQMGFPIEKSKELTLSLIKSLRANDTFNVVGFNTSAASLWSAPRPVNAANLQEATGYVNALQADGGTNVREGVVASLEGQNDPNRLRIVLFNTDGYVGDEKLILDTIQKRRGQARMYTFGIGNSVNRWLIDMMSVEGKGDSEIVTLAEDAGKAAARFVERLRTPVLTDVDVAFEGIEVADKMPHVVCDVFDNKPIVMYGRYDKPGRGKIRVDGKLGGKAWSHAVDASLSGSGKAPAIMTLWARNKVDALTREDYLGYSTGEGPNRRTEEIIDTALEFGIMTEHTSFVAVEPRVINVGGKVRTVRVPVEMAGGVSYEGTLGLKEEERYGMAGKVMRRTRNLPGTVGGAGGFGGGLSRGGGAAHQVPSTAAIYANDQEAVAGMTLRSSDQKIAKPLRAATGKVEVQVWLTKLDDAVAKQLAAKGLKVEVKDSKLRIVFGSCDANALKALAELEVVQRIEPIE